MTNVCLHSLDSHGRWLPGQMKFRDKPMSHAFRRIIKLLIDQRGSRGKRGSGPLPPERSQSYRFLSNTGPDPLKITKLHAFNVGPSSARQQNAI